jgi:hypothetical protein
MNKMCFSFLLILLMFNSSSQELNVKMAPLSILNPSKAMIPFAIEFSHNKFGFEYEHGIKIKSVLSKFNWNIGKIERRYFRPQFNLRYYFVNVKYMKQFIGTTFSYLPERYNKNKSWYIKDGNYYTYDSASILRKEFKYMITYGLKLITKSSINFELNAGLGVKYINISYIVRNGVLTNDDEIWSFWEEFPANIRYKGDGSRILPSVLVSAKIEYRLFTKTK